MKKMEYQIDGLLRELERQKQSSRDVVVSSSTLRAVDRHLPTGELSAEAQVVLTVPKNTEVTKGYLENPKAYDLMPLTPFAHGQLAKKMGIPKPYYDRMMDAGMTGLVCQNVNAWVEQKERRLVRMLDGSIRAILSDRYRCLDNHDLVWLAMDELKKADAKIVRCELTETTLYLKALMPHIERPITPVVGDVVRQGLLISNSEVGKSSLSVEPYLEVVRCSNGLIAPQSIAKIHLGGAMGLGDVWQDDTKQTRDALVWKEIRDVVQATCDERIIDQWAAQLRGAAQVGVPNMALAVENVVKAYDLPESRKNDLLDYFGRHEEPTQWGLANAITGVAKTVGEDSYERRIEMETIAGKLCALTPEQFAGVVGR